MAEDVQAYLENLTVAANLRNLDACGPAPAGVVNRGGYQMHPNIMQLYAVVLSVLARPPGQ